MYLALDYQGIELEKSVNLTIFQLLFINPASLVICPMLNYSCYCNLVELNWLILPDFAFIRQKNSNFML
jgi:hypothetical protein